MGLEDYISEIEASGLSGVSVATLNRFVEAGYLRIELDTDGLRLFSKSELKNVFGLDNFTSINHASKSRAVAKEDSSTRFEISRRVLDIESESPPAAPQSHAQIPPTSYAENSTTADTAFSFPNRTEQPSDDKGTNRLSERIEVEIIPAETHSARTEGLNNSIKAEPSELNQPTTAEVNLRTELAKLVERNQLQEKLLQQRETQIKDLEEQRTWLKTRLEKLEEKGERDQLLLLAESQTVRKLVHIQENNKSVVRQALEWLGLVYPDRNQHTIEIGHNDATTPGQTNINRK